MSSTDTPTVTKFSHWSHQSRWSRQSRDVRPSWHSRTAARKAFTHDDLRQAMGDIEYRDTDAFVDEIPAAYKDIDVVMEDASDLVEIRHTLRQIVNVKGD
ncbi:RtcB family protein [uncultured Nocardioides sp.]|uniref:RtcB family protein n=1 Tax=uncultured Nocardioides sp. TaxID=198441 RepID=UPI0026296E87|nr:RtcB family protein [uncultured Nocardioides sp.]